MKTKYEDIEFENVGNDEWVCWHSRLKMNIGDVEWNYQRKQFIYTVAPGAACPPECRDDILHFLQQLNAEKEK
jgi:hypothetical protein